MDKPTLRKDIVWNEYVHFFFTHDTEFLIWFGAKLLLSFTVIYMLMEIGV